MVFPSRVALRDPDSIPVPSSVRPYGSVTSFAVLINYIIGSGVFSLPHAVQSAGSLLSFVSLFFFCSLSMLATGYTLETLCRATGIRSFLAQSTAEGPDSAIEAGKRWEADRKLAIQNESQPLLMKNLEHSPPANYSASSLPSVTGSSAPISATYSPYLTYEKLDFSQLARLFGGDSTYYLTQGFLILYSYSVLWGSASIFSTSLSMLLYPIIFPASAEAADPTLTFSPDTQSHSCNIYSSPSASCLLLYNSCVLLFGLIVILLSLRDVFEQAFIQFVLTIYRFLSFFLMLGTCFYAFLHRNYFLTSDPLDVHSEAAVSPGQSIFHTAPLPSWDWGGFGLIFLFSGVALNFEYNIPDIFQSLQTKSKALTVACWGLLVTTAFYILIGLVCAMEFGEKTLPLVTLNWESYSGRGGGFKPLPPGETITWWAALVRLLVLGFPIINQCSMYPLVAVTTGDNLAHLMPNFGKKKCRLLAAVPPLFLAVWMGKLDFIFIISGLIAFFLELIFPCAFHILSTRYVQRMFGAGAEWTPYSGWWSRMRFAFAALSVSVIALLMAVYFSIQGDAAE